MRRIAPAAAGCLMLVLAGCTSASAGHASSTGTSAPGTTGANTVVISDFAFAPATLTVGPGTKVTVINKDATTHTLTSTASPKAFDTGDIAQGASTSFTAPAKPGTYSYICEIHQYMQGELVVR